MSKPKDIFTGGLRLPSKVCVLAPGPNGREQWPGITIFTIAVNYGVTIPLLVGTECRPELRYATEPPTRQPDMWLVGDWWGLKTDWFPPADAYYRGIRCFSRNLISKRPADALPADWSFRFTRMPSDRELGLAQYVPGTDCLRPDGTSSCMAIELAARFGAREIGVCGMDFWGETYFDGRKGTFQMYDRKGPWFFLPFANSLIAWVKAQGIDIYSLSQTELDLEVRDGQ